MLPKNEKNFHISVVGEITEQNMEGDFTCVCVPTGAQRNAIMRMENRENGDMQNVPTELFMRAKWLANVKGRLLNWPDWWDGVRQGDSLLDDNVLKEVYDQCIEAEVEWRKAIKEKAKEAASTLPTPPPST